MLMIAVKADHYLRLLSDRLTSFLVASVM